MGSDSSKQVVKKEKKRPKSSSGVKKEKEYTASMSFPSDNSTDYSTPKKANAAKKEQGKEKKIERRQSELPSQSERSAGKSTFTQHRSPKKGATTNTLLSNSTFKPKQSQDENKSKYVALDTYQARDGSDELTINKDDQLIILNMDNNEWWMANNLNTGRKGYVPANLVTSIGNLKAKDTSRRDSERLLEYLGNELGVFLLRYSEKDKTAFTLSLLHYDDKKQRHVRHYKIKRDVQGRFFISDRKKFDSLDELIEYHKSVKDPLCRLLLAPCEKPTKFVGFKDVWEESRENIEIVEMIGSGAYGEVYRGMWRKKYEVAVKTMKFNSDVVDKDELQKKIDEFRKELGIMKKLRHEKLVKLWCVCTIGEPVYIVTEYMCNGSLLKYLREGDGQRLRLKEVTDMAAQIASGMKYLDQSNCVHRDLAARNILVGEQNIVKIADFGFAQILENGKFVLAKGDDKFPVRWTAPEVFIIDPETKERIFTSKSDVWSYGILLYELVTLGGLPYQGMSHQQVVYEVRDRQYRLPKPNGLCTDYFYSIMLKCWHEIPANRPTFAALYDLFNDYEHESGYKIDGEDE